nr:DUF3397 family protein [Lentilactobacillus sp. SPB1-3]MCZ0977820.1 DUF3397 family protein [Lentilactobacillus sp. SPB1-3]
MIAATIVNDGGLIIYQVIALVILTILTRIISRIKPVRKHVKLIPLDLWPPFFILTIYQLTVHYEKVAILPYVICGWIIVALVVLGRRIFTDQQFTYKKSLLMLWRIADLWFPLAWILIIIFK